MISIGTVLILVLAIVAIGCALLAAALWVAWWRSRQATRLLALRLDAESKVEAATLQTLSAMREAARVYVRQRDE